MDAESKVEEIRDAAERLLAAARASRPPVDLVEVARLQGINTIRQRKMTSTLGTLRESSDGLIVTLNRREPFRARFTLAHEIAHTMVDPPDAKAATVTLARRKPRAGSELERLCDEIAVELLLPYQMFRQEMAGEPVSLSSIFRLAKLFDASLQATSMRAGELANEPVQVICWERAGRTSARVKAKRGRDFLTVGDGNHSLSPRSPIAKAFEGRSTERGAELASPDANLAYDVEARGFLRGNARFVISIIHPQGVRV